MFGSNFNLNHAMNLVENEDHKDEDFVKPPVRRTSRRRFGRSTLDIGKPKNVESLQFLAGSYVVQHQRKLTHFYTKMLKKAWKMITSNQYSGAALEKCYDTVRDLNKKKRLLRGIEDDNITEMTVADYGDENIFLREKKMAEVVSKNPFSDLDLD